MAENAPPAREHDHPGHEHMDLHDNFCPSCGQKNPRSGKEQLVKCARCGAGVDAGRGEKFCKNCGTSVEHDGYCSSCKTPMSSKAAGVKESDPGGKCPTCGKTPSEGARFRFFGGVPPGSK